MPRFQDVLNESFHCLDRDDLDVCELICPRWKATVDRLTNASLALRRMIDVTFKKIEAGKVIVVVRRFDKDDDCSSNDRTVPLSNGSRVDRSELQAIASLLRNSFVEYDMRIRCCDDIEGAVFTIVLLREVQNCRVSRVELVDPCAFVAKLMLQAAHQNLKAKEYDLVCVPNEFGTPAWKELVSMDFVRCADYLALPMSMHNRNPANLEWMEDIRALRGVTEVSLWVADANSCAELMLDRLIEAYIEDATAFPRKLKLWSTDATTEYKWINSMRSRNYAEKQTKSGYSTFHFADSSGNVKMTVATLCSVYLYRGCVDILTAFPHAADCKDDKNDDGRVQGDYDLEESSDSDAQLSDDGDQ